MADKNNDLEKIIDQSKSDPINVASTQKNNSGKLFLNNFVDSLKTYGKAYGRHVARITLFNFSGNVRTYFNNHFPQLKLNDLGAAYKEALILNYAVVAAGVGAALYPVITPLINSVIFPFIDLHTLDNIYLFDKINLVSAAASGLAGYFVGEIEYNIRADREFNENKALPSLAGKILSLPFDAGSLIYDWIGRIEEKYYEKKNYKSKYHKNKDPLQLKLFDRKNKISS